MPRLTTELTPEREAVVLARQARARAAVAAIPAPSVAEREHTTATAARTAASRCGCPNTEVAAVRTETGWVGVVRIRTDQAWMRRQIEERGCRAEVSA